MLSNILHRSTKVHGSNPFIQDQDVTITYEESHELSCIHQQWMRQILTNAIQKLDANHTLSSTSKNDAEIVIAYLSYNSADLLFSILSTIGINVIKIGHWNVNIRVAILNFRWSSKEISKALQVYNSERIKSGKIEAGGCSHITMLMYGQDMEQLAKESWTLINSSSGQNFLHTCIMYKIPSFLLEDITSNQITSHPRKMHSINATHAQSLELNDKNHFMDEAIILFTSGTTSGPKGVKLSHMALFIQAMAKLHNPCCYDEYTKMLATTVPFFHVGGLNSAIALILAGGCFVFPKQSGHSFDAKLVVQSITSDVNRDSSSSRRRSLENIGSVNTLVIVPAMLHSILNEISSNGDDMKGLNTYENVRLILIGGQSISERQFALARKFFPHARIVQTYACTEAASSLTFANLYDPMRIHTSDHYTFVNQKKSNDNIENYEGVYVGIPPPHVEIGIFEQKDGKATMKKAPPYTVGVIGTTGPHIMNGYWKRGEEKEEVGIISNWLQTNDLGYINDSGGLYFCGRLNDVIRTGGESVFAAEVESILLRHPNINECAVFGLPDERLGECVCSAIVLKKPLSGDVQKRVREFCRSQQLTNYKRPRKVFVLEHIPRNSLGKVLKNELIRQILLRSKL